MNDRIVGSIIFIASLLIAVGYIYWLFFPPPSESLNWLFYSDSNMRWAIVLPVLLAVILIAFIAMWIGWTMATTPPPPTLEEIEGKKKEAKS